MRLSQSVLGCHCALARDVDQADRVGDCMGLGCVRTRGPFYSKAAAVRQIRGLAVDPASSSVVPVAESHMKKGSP